MPMRVEGAGTGTVTRRDFLEGLALAVGALPLQAAAAGHSADPALRNGLQGQTDAAMAAAHGWRDDPARHTGPAQADEGVEDLVVVGAGLGGLAGAWWFARHASLGRPARILLLESLDELGGHARRNEFVSRSGQRRVGYGGSQTLDSPGLFSPAVHALLRGVGIELKRFETEWFDQGWAARHGLTRQATFFAADAWGEPRMVLRAADEPAATWLARTPLDAGTREGLVRLQARRSPAAGRLAGLSRAALRSHLAATTYRDFLLRDAGLDAGVARYLQHRTLGYFGVGIDATSALDARAAGLPGFAGLNLGTSVDARMSPSGRQLHLSEDEYIHHFPDGNAGVARALLRTLNPAALPGQGIESLVENAIDRSVLDDPASPVRLRLQSLVVDVRHDGAPGQAEQVRVRYVDSAGRLREVRARQVLLACWHRVIARLAPELPAAQREALRDQVKVPMIYATVLLSNWRPWAQAGIVSIATPGGFWQDVALDYPVSIGGLKFPQHPDEPILLHLGKVFAEGQGRPPREQAAAGRAQLLSLGFADFEREIRSLLQGALGEFGFVQDDIEAITVNRWAHGYAYEYMRPWDRYWPQGTLPCEVARRGFGRIAIANADSGAYAYAHSAIDQAARAVAELLPRARLPRWAAFPGPARLGRRV